MFPFFGFVEKCFLLPLRGDDLYRLVERRQKEGITPMPGHVAQARRHRRNSLILPSASARDELSVLYGLCGKNAGGSALTPRPSRSDKSGTRCNADRIFAALKVVPSRRAKGAVKRFIEMGLCTPCRGAPTVFVRFSCQRSIWKCHWHPEGFGADWWLGCNLALPPIACPLKS